ncbi:MAG TPA: YXWGXW repeat-containing protein [Steroidobacteraceae bacterium]|nr:YXWGXW repeat-containing protein [Steroidobacteraceae bacterium]
MRRRLLALIPMLLLCAAPCTAPAGVMVGVSVNIAPPALPVYVQPAIPAPGYLWVPGYWAWNPQLQDYYWVPGTWVLPPVSGLLWTPGWWGWSGGAYLWHPGYWGPHVGFYGGVNYGYGYTGHGFHGGYWHGGAFFYNRAVTNFGHAHIVDNYVQPVPHARPRGASFNGGPGGIRARPTAADRLALRDHHVDYAPGQRQHELAAAGRPQLRASVNRGHPAMAAVARAGEFSHAARTQRAHPQAHAPERHAQSHGGGQHPQHHPQR